MRYIEKINTEICKSLKKKDDTVVFGQNISLGSCLSGLTKNISLIKNLDIINTTNCENSLAGFGFGLLMNGKNSIFFTKQLDFILLSLDQIVNTYNQIRLCKVKNSFTIFAIIVDSGFEGPQSRLNNLSDFGSMAWIDCYTISTYEEANNVLNKHLFRPGFKIICVSQKKFNNEICQLSYSKVNKDRSIIQYTVGESISLVSFNFAFEQAKEISKQLLQKNKTISLFSVSSVLNMDWSLIIESVKKTKRLIILDDSRTIFKPYDNLVRKLEDLKIEYDSIIFDKKPTLESLKPNKDDFNVDIRSILKKFSLNND